LCGVGLTTIRYISKKELKKVVEGSLNAYMILVEKPEDKKPLGRPGVDGWVTLKCIFGKRN
jgi:hypothetical protein